MMIPGIINTVPLYTLMRRIGGINTRWAMALVLAANALPFSVFLYTNFIRSMSKEIEESAIVDGCTWFSAFWRITFPLLKPVTAAVVIVNGLESGTTRTSGLLLKASCENGSSRSIDVLSASTELDGTSWLLLPRLGQPAVAAFILFQRQFIKGLAAGA